MREMNMIKQNCVVLMMTFLISFNLSYASIVDGIIALEYQTDHTGILIEFFPVSPTAKYASTYSNSLGVFSDSIDNGLYNIQYTHTGYISKIDSGILIFQDITFNNDTLKKPPTPPNPPLNLKGIYSPYVSGIWYRDTIYHIHADISVRATDSLYIQPGTHIYLDDENSFTINHKVHAHGTDSLPIIFDTLHLMSEFTIEVSSIDSVHISNISIKSSYVTFPGQYQGLIIHERQGNKGHFVEKIRMRRSGNIFVSGNHLIYDCDIMAGSIIVQKGRPHIVKNTIYTSYSGGIVGSNGVVTGNKLFSCKGLSLDSAEEVSYNLLNRCFVGLEAGIGVGKIYNNTFYDNKTAILFSSNQNDSVDMQMNIFSENDVGVNFNGKIVKQGYNLYNNTLDFENSSAILGIGLNLATNASDDSIDTYYNIVNVDTTFVRTDPSDPYFLWLNSNSMAIDAADSSFKDLDGSVRDLGAFPYDSVIWEGIVAKSVKKELFKIYPNPTKEVLYLETLDEKEIRTVQIFDITGRLMIQKTLANQVKIKINVGELSVGLYMVKVVSDSGHYSAKFFKN